MDRPLLERLSPILDALFDADEAERPALLDALCGDDAELRAAVVALLAADAESGLLDRPIDLPPADGDEEPAEAVEPGFRIGPYRVLHELGRGGMGAVYLAERADGGFRQQVALKVIKRGLDSEEVVRRFLAERQILARLEHPGIARLLDGGLAQDGRPYFALEHVAGASPIHRYCAERQLDVPARLRLFVDVCRAVEHAHRNLVVHRDLKPSNILVTADGAVKLLDFGIAKLLDPAAGETSLTRAERGPMTPEYAAPEQLKGEPITTATDVYGLGAVLYEVLTGSRPFAAVATGSELERAVLLDDVERPSSVLRRRGRKGQEPATRLPRRLAEDLDTLVATALRKAPERRYASATALREDLERFLAGRPLRAHPDSFGYRVGKLVARHRLAFAAAALLLLSLVGGLAGTLWQARLARLEARKATEVKDFVVGLFAGADPDVAREKGVSALALVDRGAERFDRELAGQPEVQAELLGLVGDLYLKLGMNDRAGPIVERELELARELYGAASPEMAAPLSRLAVVRRGAGDLGQAEPPLREALEIRRRVNGREALETIAVEADLGELLSARGNPDEAIVLFDHALGALARAGAARSATAALAHNGKGLALAGKGEAEAAEPLFEAALAIRREVYGERHSLVVQSLGNLAAIRRMLGRTEAAAADLRKVVDLQRELFGDDHRDVGEALVSLGTILDSLGQLAEAERLLRQALPILEKALGADNPNLARSYSALGANLHHQGRDADAEPLLRRAAALNRELVGDDHPRQASILIELGSTLAALGKPSEAEELLRRAVGTLRTAGPPFEETLGHALSALGRLLCDSRRREEGAPVLAEGVALLQRLSGVDDAKTKQAASTLAACRAPN